MKKYGSLFIGIIFFCFIGCAFRKPYDVAIQNIGKARRLNESKVLVGSHKLSMGYIRPIIFKTHSFVQDSVKINESMTLEWKRDNGQSFSEVFDLKDKFQTLGTNEYYIIVFKIDDNDNAAVGVYICTHPNNCLDDWL